MASILKVDDLRGNTSAGDITITSEGGSATMQLQQGVVKAWAAFEQSGTHSVYDDFNFSSLSDLGTGQTRWVFTNNMDNVNYATIGMSGERGGGGNRAVGLKGDSANPATTGFDIANFTINNSASDDTGVSISVMGDLA